MISPDINILFVALAALVPMIIGAIYFGPIFGKQWLDSLGYTESDIPEPIKMPVVYGLSLFLAFVLSYFLVTVNEHMHKGVNDAGELILTSDHTFGHGAYHGLLLGLVISIPVLVSNLLFQRNTGKNILLNATYWVITIAIMGGILDAFAVN